MKNFVSLVLAGIAAVGCSDKAVFDTPEAVAVTIYRAVDNYDIKTIDKYLPADIPAAVKSSMDISMFALYQPFKLCGGLKNVSITKTEQVQGKLKVISNLSFNGNCVDTADQMIFTRYNNKLVLDLKIPSNRVNTEIIGKY